MDHHIYRNMHSYPYQRDQIHYSPHFYPGTEPIPTQMYTNPSRPPINYGYAPPIACHGCCNHHSYMPAHYPNWGSPYSHHIPHPPHCPVSYPSFPAQCMTCYPMEQPRYEFEKNVPATPGQHCCGCSNHPSLPRESRNVRVEEEEPGSMAPLQLKNGHSPIVWMPPDNYSNKEQRKDNDNDNNNNQVVWNDGAKNGWFPLDLNNLVSMKKQTGDEERKHQRDDDEDGEGRRFPFPLFWIPYKPEDKEMEKHNLSDVNTKPSLEPEKGSLGEKKTQVKEVEKHKEEEGSKNRERESNASVKDGVIDHGEKKLSNESVKRKNPSPPKSSKLPPVCLRVDPLPRRKTANGSSRSDEAKSKVINSSDDKKVCNIVSTNEVKEGKGTKTIEVVDGKTRQEKNMDVNVEVRVDQPEVKPEEENITRECIENGAMKGQSEEVASAMGKNEEGIKETSKRKLSEEEAAVIIQSVYRGFDTRRWDPVKKLKEIAKVRDQIDSVKHMIQAMESCSGIKGSNKQRNVISEIILSLLLKLDTIQGLHPSIREVRKSVVKELVTLQEKLDSIMNEKSGNSPQQESNTSCAEDADVTLYENDNKTESESTDLPQADQNQPDDDACNCEISEANLIGEDSMEKIEKEDETSNDEGPYNNENNHLELAELPLGVFDDDFDAQQNTVQKMVDAEMKKTCQEEQVTSELQNDATDNENYEISYVDQQQHPQDVTAGKVEPSEASGDRELLTTEKEMSGQQLPQEGNSERDIVEESNTAEKEPENDTTEENANGDEKIGVLDIVSNNEGADDLTESNKKLIEENERLRGILENLIKSGQEQLTAISSLTGRVKDLERKLSKKNKVKVKQHKRGSKMRRSLVDE